MSIFGGEYLADLQECVNWMEKQEKNAKDAVFKQAMKCRIQSVKRAISKEISRRIQNEEFE